MTDCGFGGIAKIIIELRRIMWLTAVPYHSISSLCSPDYSLRLVWVGDHIWGKLYSAITEGAALMLKRQLAVGLSDDKPITFKSVM